MPIDLPPNKFKRALAKGELQIGLWLALTGGTSAEIAAQAGFDWLCVDMEHGPFELPQVLEALRAAGANTEPVVRVPWNEPVIVKRVLDIGARTIMFPMVQNVTQAKAAVAATRYPSKGIRGLAGSTRASGYGRIPEYVARCADELCVIVQIESPEAIALIPEIAAVEGVDAVFIGPFDLAANSGIAGQRYADSNKAMVQKGLDLIKAAGKPAGIIDSTPDETPRLIKAGFTFVAVGLDAALLARATDHLVQTYKPKK